MFFDPKMQLVWVDGPLEKLDAFIENCCVDGKRVHPARAPDHMSASAGYAALNEENPWGPLVAQPDIPAFTESCASVGGLNIAQDMVLPMRR